MDVTMTRSSLQIIATSGAVFMLLAGVHPALAISHVSSVTHSCADLQKIIDREGAVIVTHPGSRNSGTLYDRYVSDSAKCSAGEIADDDWVPTQDGSCRISNCQPYEPPFDN